MNENNQDTRDNNQTNFKFKILITKLENIIFDVKYGLFEN